MLGIDVSAHQDSITWPKVRAAGVSVAYIKATEGVGHVDERFRANWSGARAAGIAVGAYHYFSLCSDAGKQAEAFLAAAPPDPRALPPAIDLELDGACTQRPDRASVEKSVTMFTTAVEKAWGRPLVVYSSGPWRGLYAIPGDGRPAWLTRHEGRPQGDWAIWQVRFTARIDGVPGKVDLDVVRPAALGATRG